MNQVNGNLNNKNSYIRNHNHRGSINKAYSNIPASTIEYANTANSMYDS